MATNFPTSLDALTNPTATDTLDSVTVPHADQHANANDAIEALQAKVGADGSAVTTSHDYKIAQLEAQPAVTGGDSHDHTTGNGALIPAAGLDTDNSAADGDLMSYSDTTGKMTWLKSVTYQPSSGTAVVGTVTAGTYADAQSRGGVAWTIQEVVGIPGYDVQLTFSSVVNFNEIRAYMRYQGGGSHLCEVGLKDGDAATFTTLTSFNSQNGLSDVIIQVDNGPSYIATDGSVTVRFYHPVTGNGTTHFLYLDMVNLLLAVTGGGGVTDHRALSNRLDAEAHPATAITSSASTTGLAATTVEAALTELNAEKIEGSGVAKITVGTDEPVTPATGDLWIDTN
jgi:hypothetical protein